MNEITRHSNYGSKDRFPPSDDDLSASFMDYKPFRISPKEMNLDVGFETCDCDIFSRIMSIFCSCHCPKEET